MIAVVLGYNNEGMTGLRRRTLSRGGGLFRFSGRVGTTRGMPQDFRGRAITGGEKRCSKLLVGVVSATANYVKPGIPKH